MSRLPKNVTSLLNRLYDEDIPTIKKSKKLKLGNLYLFGYNNPKTKSSLPYYDVIPLVVLFGWNSSTMVGINAHYIPYTYRIQLLTELNKRMANNSRLRYSQIKAAWKAARIPKAYYYLAIRRYLVNRISTNVKVFEGEDNWKPVVAKVLPKFKKKTNSYVIRDIQKQMKKHSKEVRSSKK